MDIILVDLTFFGVILAGAIVRHVVSKREVPTARLQLVKTFSGLVEDAKRMGDIPAFWLEGGRLALSPVAATSSLRNALQFPQDVYYHYGHAWAKLDEDKRVR